MREKDNGGRGSRQALPPSLPMAAQAAWSDLVRLLQEESVSDLRGTPATKTVKRREFWYDRYRVGSKMVERFIGEDCPALRDRLARHAEIRSQAKARAEETRRLVRLLRAGGCLAPDRDSGKVLLALARAGVFRLGGTLVGTHAFRLYDGVLGFRMTAEQAAITRDIDIASFEGLSVALEDTVDPALSSVFRELEFEPVPMLGRALGGREIAGKTWRWRHGGGALVEFLTPSFENDERLRDLPSLGVSAQSLHFLNYLIAEPIPAPVLYREGVLVQIPRPERFAIHKLIVAARRRSGVGRDKARKDLAQAAFLCRILAEEDPDLLGEAHADARRRGPAWVRAIDASLARLPNTTALLAGL